MIEIKNLSKSYGDTVVYENFSLSLEEGKVTCVLGESGSGKTTLLNCLARLADCGGELPQIKCSYIFQSPRLVPNLTVYKNLSLICPDGEKVKKMLERVKLTDKAQDYPKSLSGGQAQRAAIARAFLFGGDLMLLDEPFSSLDLKLKTEMAELFMEIRREHNATALFVTHDIDEAVALADRIIVIKNGQVVCDLTPETCAPREYGGSEGLRKSLIEVLTA